MLTRPSYFLLLDLQLFDLRYKGLNLWAKKSRRMRPNNPLRTSFPPPPSIGQTKEQTYPAVLENRHCLTMTNLFLGPTLGRHLNTLGELIFFCPKVLAWRLDRQSSQVLLKVYFLGREISNSLALRSLEIQVKPKISWCFSMTFQLMINQTLIHFSKGLFCSQLYTGLY